MEKRFKIHHAQDVFLFVENFFEKIGAGVNQMGYWIVYNSENRFMMLGGFVLEEVGGGAAYFGA